MSDVSSPDDGWRASWLGDGLALAAGALSVLAFAPLGWWPLALMGSAGLFMALRGAGGWRGLWRGWLFGVGLFGFGIAWIVESFQFNHVPLEVAVLATGGLVVLLSLYPAVAGAVVGWYSRGRSPAVLVLLFWAGAWSGIEWLRGWALTGFSWLELGASQINGPLSAWYPLIGSAGTGFLVALLGGLLALALGIGARHWIALGGVAAFMLASQALGGFDRTQSAGAPIRVALVQGNVPQDEKWRPENRAPTLAHYLGQTRAIGEVDVVLWPETAIPGILPRMGAFLARVAEYAREHEIEVVSGIPSVDRASGRPLNVAVKIGGRTGTPASQARNGEVLWPRYVKRHLVPFGEFVPWPSVVRPVVDALNVRLSNFAPGASEQALLEAGGHAVGISICYEIAFSRDVRRDLPGAQWLVNLSNDAWFGDTIGPHQHLELARVRAREVGRYVVRGTNTGVSALIDHRGQVRARLPQFEAATLSGLVEPRSGATPYVVWGDRPLWFAIVVVLAAGLVARRCPRGAPASAQTSERDSR